MLNFNDIINNSNCEIIVMEFIEKTSPKIREIFLPSLMYTHETIFEVKVEKETKKRMIQAINEANHIVGNIFDINQINLAVAMIVSETIERLETNRKELSRGELLNIILDNNRENPTAQTKEFVLLSITDKVQTGFIEIIEDYYKSNPDKQNLTYIFEEVFSLELIEKMVVNVIDLFDEYIFDRMK